MFPRGPLFGRDANVSAHGLKYGVPRMRGRRRPMHPALQNYDILLILFGFFSCSAEVNQTRIDSFNRGVLFNLASTCKAFCDPALDILWTSIDGLAPLQSLVEGFSGDSSKPEGSFRHEDLVKLTRYAKRVRSLTADGTSTLEAAYTQIATFRNVNEPLFPGLRHLCVAIDMRTTLDGLALVVSPSLKSLRIQNAKGYDIENTWSTQLVDQLMASIVDLNPPGLQSIWLDIGLNQWWAYGLLSKLDLHHLTLAEPIDADFFTTIILGLTKLISLSLVIAEGTNPKELFPASYMEYSPFKDLKSLDVYADPICLLYVVRKFDAPNLCELKLGSSEDSSCSSWWDDCYYTVTGRWRKKVRMSGFSGERL